jgi:asparagine N-glycosylation enzyme membrane subunit Stt3
LKKGKIVTQTGNKNYHINIIQKIYTEQGIEFKRYRVVMNKMGIKRIEPVELDHLI